MTWGRGSLTQVFMDSFDRALQADAFQPQSLARTDAVYEPLFVQAAVHLKANSLLIGQHVFPQADQLSAGGELFADVESGGACRQHFDHHDR